jgi:hypothetical protein
MESDNVSDRLIADGRFYREFSYRDASKRLGHGSNYQGEPKTMSRETHIPIGDIETSNETTSQIRIRPLVGVGRSTNQVLRHHNFIHWTPSEILRPSKRPRNIRAAIAYEPQNVTADTIDEGLLDVWRGDRVQLLLQVHDSILFQYKEEEEDEIIPWALEQCKRRRVLKGGREFVIPAEAKVGLELV